MHIFSPCHPERSRAKRGEVEGPAVVLRLCATNAGCPRSLAFGDRGKIATILCALLLAASNLSAQAPRQSVQGSPIAIVPLDAPGDQAPTVTGALEVTAGKAIIVTSGSVTSGSTTTNVTLPRRGTLRVCASTTVKLAVDSSVPAGNMSGLLMAMDHGALEISFAMSFATAPASSNADILMTPDFRILIGGPGASEVKVRLGTKGDTCVDNSGKDAPYVVVTSLFSTGLYRVQSGQRVMFQHGSLDEVVDQEKEPCGCPPPPKPGGNEFPLAQSAGLAPLPVVAPPPATNLDQGSAAQQVAPPLVYDSSKPQEPANAAPASSQTAAQPAVPEKPAIDKKKPGIFARLGKFFRQIFGAE